MIFSLLSACLFTLMGMYAYNALEREVARRDDLALLGRIDRIKLAIEDNQGIEVLKNQPELYENMLGNKDNLLWIVDAKGELLIEVNPVDLPMPTLPTLKSSALFTVTTPEPTRMAWLKVNQGQQWLYIIVGKLLVEPHNMLSAYGRNLVIALLVGVLLAFMIGWEAARRGLKPLHHLSKQAAAIGPQDLGLRLDEHSQPQELQLLTAALNLMLTRLEDGYQRLSQFSEDLAHEMRTPLNNLMIQNQLALSQLPTVEGYEQLLDSQQEEYERLSRMIDNMLFLARAEKQDTVLQFEAVELAKLSQQLAAYFEGMAQERGMQIEVKAQGVIHADTRLVRRALANLLANAIRYGASDSVISVRSEQRDKQCLDIEVINQGPQIESQDLPKIFDRFYRCDPSRSRPDDSGGLGLAIVKSIMHMHGGSVMVSSEHGATCFTLRFPAHQNTPKL